MERIRHGGDPCRGNFHRNALAQRQFRTSEQERGDRTKCPSSESRGLNDELKLDYGFRSLLLRRMNIEILRFSGLLVGSESSIPEASQRNALDALTFKLMRMITTGVTLGLIDLATGRRLNASSNPWLTVFGLGIHARGRMKCSPLGVGTSRQATGCLKESSTQPSDCP